MESPLLHSVRSICCYHQWGTCCWAPCGATTCLINPKPCAEALTTHNLVAYHLPSCILGWLCTIMCSQEQGNTAMTAASGHLNQPPISIETPHFMYPPPSFLAVSRHGFTSFEPLGQRSVDLPGHHSNSLQHQMSRELADHDEGRQRALFGQPLPSGEQRKQDKREKNCCFVKQNLGFSQCLECRGLWQRRI